MRAAAAIAVIGVLLVASCSDSASDSDSGSTTPTAVAPSVPITPIAAGQAPVRVELIRPAIAAVEKELGGAQQFFEVNATPTLVNLFVATSAATQAVAYVFAAGTLQPPAVAQPAHGPTFGAADLTFDETTVLATTVASLPDSTFRVFSAVGAPSGGVEYLVTVDSSRGGQFQVTVGPTGAVLGTNGQLTPPTTPVGS